MARDSTTVTSGGHWRELLARPGCRQAQPPSHFRTKADTTPDHWFFGGGTGAETLTQVESISEREGAPPSGRCNDQRTRSAWPSFQVMIRVPGIRSSGRCLGLKLRIYRVDNGLWLDDPLEVVEVTSRPTPTRWGSEFRADALEVTKVDGTSSIRTGERRWFRTFRRRSRTWTPPR